MGEDYKQRKFRAEGGYVERVKESAVMFWDQRVERLAGRRKPRGRLWDPLWMREVLQETRSDKDQSPG